MLILQEDCSRQYCMKRAAPDTLWKRLQAVDFIPAFFYDKESKKMQLYA